MITYRLSGQVVKRGSPSGVPGVRVEAWDSAGVKSDLIAVATTDKEGAFTITLGQGDVDRHFDGRLPALSLRLFLGSGHLATRDHRWKVARRPASVRIEVDPQDVTEQYEPPLDGATVVLTIDAGIQQAAEKHLREAVEKFSVEWGAALVMDPRSGEVLALAVEPGFHPLDTIPPDEKLKHRALERRRNRAIADAFEPGSIFKPFVASAALDAGIVRLDEWFEINGPRRAFGRRTIQDVHPYARLQFFEVISKSSNIGMGLLGQRAGNARLSEWVRRFGFGQLTGIGLPGESAGLLADLDQWTSFSTQSIPIGQEISVTPLQMLTAFCALSNDGVLYRPRIVRGVVRTDGTVVEDCSQPVAVRRVVRAEIAHEFRQRALAETVRTGTGKGAAIPGYQVFGKTGTAQVAERGRGYTAGSYVGSFVGGAPAGEPRVAVLVSLYKPGGRAYYGGTIAAPTAGRIIGDALEYLGVQPESSAEFGAAVPR
ncbi:MAG: penicillin-binding protein 2 [Phycisphaerae bacterium]|nr:penicillin-binding protein 2 [Phycisphaerae bacterium]